jgi:hypothetical protein
VLLEADIMEGKSDDVSALKPVMQTELELSFVKKVRMLLHVTKLELGASGDGIAQSPIQTVPIVVVDLPTIANVPLPVHKQLVIKRQVPRTLSNYGRVKRNGDGQRISEAGSKVLTFDPPLLESETMSK